MIAFWQQIKATSNGAAGLVVFVTELALMLLSAAVFAVATIAGAGTIAAVAGTCTLVFAFLTPAVTAFAQGYRQAGTGVATLSNVGVLWHVTSTRWEVGEQVVFDHRRCRLRSCVQQAARPFSLPRRAVYFFTVDPGSAHVLGNVSRGRAQYVYRLAGVRFDSDVFSRGTAIAVTGDVHAVIAERTEWHG